MSPQIDKKTLSTEVCVVIARDKQKTLDHVFQIVEGVETANSYFVHDYHLGSQKAFGSDFGKAVDYYNSL